MFPFYLPSNVSTNKAVDELDLSLLQATEGSQKKDTDISTTKLSKVILCYDKNRYF